MQSANVVLQGRRYLRGKDDTAGFQLYFLVVRHVSCLVEKHSQEVVELKGEQPKRVSRRLWRGSASLVGKWRKALVLDQICQVSNGSSTCAVEGGLHGGTEFSTISNTASSKPQSPFQFAISCPILKWSAKWSALKDQVSKIAPQKPQRDLMSGTATLQSLADQSSRPAL